MSLKVGDSLPMGLWANESCDEMGERDGIPSFCSLKPNHEGPHIEADSQFIVTNVWEQD